MGRTARSFAVLAWFAPLTGGAQVPRASMPNAEVACANPDTTRGNDGRPRGATEHVMLALRAVTAAGATAMLVSDSRREMAKCARHGGGGAPYDRDLGRFAYDGLCLRRWQHHLLRAYIATTISDVVQDVTGWPEWACASVATFSVGVAAHLVGYARHEYGFNAAEWTADAWFATYPLVRLAVAPAAGSLGAMTVWVGVYYVVYPYASP